MGKIVVNKHFDRQADITPEKFSNKGEIIISNQVGLEGIYLQNKNGDLLFIGPTSGTGSEISTEYKEYISNLLKSYSTTEEMNDAIKASENNVREIAKEESSNAVAEIVAGADARYDTLKEIADWITNDTTGAASMANDIEALKEEIKNLPGSGSGAAANHYVMTQEQYEELLNKGEVIVGGKTIIYNDSAYYLIYEDNSQSGSTTGSTGQVSGDTMVISGATVDEKDPTIVILPGASVSEDGILIFGGSSSGEKTDAEISGNTMEIKGLSGDAYSEEAKSLTLPSEHFSVLENNILEIK